MMDRQRKQDSYSNVIAARKSSTRTTADFNEARAMMQRDGWHARKFGRIGFTAARIAERRHENPCQTSRAASRYRRVGLPDAQAHGENRRLSHPKSSRSCSTRRNGFREIVCLIRMTSCQGDRAGIETGGIFDHADGSEEGGR